MRGPYAVFAGYVLSFAASSSLQNYNEGLEATSMLQTLGRSSMRRSSEALDALLLSATRMLREGAAIDVLSFADNTLTAIKGEVVPALERDHAAQQDMINEHFKTISDFLATHHARAESLQEAEVARAEKSGLHRSCRLQEASVAVATVHCEEELSKVWDGVQDEEGDLDDITESIASEWCLKGVNTSLPMFRDASEKKFSHYTSKLLKMRTVWHEYEEWRQSCMEKRGVSDVQSTDCDELQYELEEAACESAGINRALNGSLFDEWPLITRIYNDTVNSVDKGEVARKEEFSTLTVVECLLDEIRLRGGLPCNETGPGNASEAIAHCYNETVNTTHLNISYPATPGAPELGPQQPAPCSAEYMAAEYGGFPAAVHVAECKPCVGDILVLPEHTTTTAQVVVMR